MNKLIPIMLMILLSPSLFSADGKKEFEPKGSPFVKVYANYNNKSTGGDNAAAFEIKRAYFGYSYKMSKAFSGKVTMDVGNPKDGGKLEMTAYLKHAFFQYKANGLTTKFGLIGTSIFKIQEDQWGNRYLFKSFQDEYKFGPSADMGAYVSYKIHKMISVSASVLNGEGYKNLQSDNIMKYTAGLTLSPLDGLTLRAYYDEMGNETKQRTMAFFLGYKLDKFSAGAEYNIQNNHKNIDKNNISGMSFYGSYKLDFMKIFARFDQLSSKDDWNTEKDGSVIIAGLEFFPTKGIKITPNYQGWTPRVDGADVTHGMYLNCEIKF